MAGKLSRTIYWTTCLLAAIVLAGCPKIQTKPGGANILARRRISADSVVLEVFSIHIRRDDRQLYDAIWDEVDEPAVSAETRHHLGENGFRVGVVSGDLPRAIQRLLELHSQPRPESETESEDSLTKNQGVNVVTFDGRPKIRIRQMTLRARKRGEIAVSGIYERAPLLFREDGQLRGQSYLQCQGMLAVKPFPLPDGRVRLEIVPEVHHGPPRRRFTSSEGVIQLETGRARKVFTKLAQEITLSPGDMYVIGSLPQRPGSLGDYFFSVETANPPQNKVLFIRLARTQQDDLFALEAE